MNTTFRNYQTNPINTIENTYKSMLQNQTLKYVIYVNNELSMTKPVLYDLWTIIDNLESIVKCFNNNGEIEIGKSQNV